MAKVLMVGESMSINRRYAFSYNDISHGFVAKCLYRSFYNITADLLLTDQITNRRNRDTVVPVQNCSHHHQYIGAHASGR